jgi:hypothetical protein
MYDVNYSWNSSPAFDWQAAEEPVYNCHLRAEIHAGSGLASQPVNGCVSIDPGIVRSVAFMALTERASSVQVCDAFLAAEFGDLGG